MQDGGARDTVRRRSAFAHRHAMNGPWGRCEYASSGCVPSLFYSSEIRLFNSFRHLPRLTYQELHAKSRWVYRTLKQVEIRNREVARVASLRWQFSSLSQFSREKMERLRLGTPVWWMRGWNAGWLGRLILGFVPLLVSCAHWTCSTGLKSTE